MTDELIEQVARDIADALGDNFNYAFARKADWTAHRGETPAGFRDVNQPYKPDYIDAAQAALAAINLPAMDRASYTQGWNEAIDAAATIADHHRKARRAAHNEAHRLRAKRQATSALARSLEAQQLMVAIRALTKENSDD